MTERRVLSVIRGPSPALGKELIFLGDEVRMKLNLFDSHVHTAHSFDARDGIGEICAHALSHGVMGVAITDHYDCDMVEKCHCQEIQKTFRELPACQEAYKNRLRITKGIELGQGQAAPDVAEAILREGGFDVVLGSIHSAGPCLDISEVNFNDPAVRVSDILGYYFQAVYDMAVWGNFDVMAHLGYPERYIWGKYRIPVNFTPFEELIQETLRRLVDTGKGLEVNTSGYRQGLGKTIPVTRILQRYYQLGGRIVTLGSDAHRKEDVASDFGVAMDLLTGIGFEYFAFYRQRQPVMLKLI